MKNNRREFIKQTGLAGLAITTVPIQNTFREIKETVPMENKIKFLSPVDGDMLTGYDGKLSEGNLLTEVKVEPLRGQ
ncbi:MAG: hypothetical protein IPJ37_07595 [Bacteroidales bacterium]|nr:hypothetical protein [Bacteroidales bacterium]